MQKEPYIVDEMRATYVRLLVVGAPALAKLRPDADPRRGGVSRSLPGRASLPRGLRGAATSRPATKIFHVPRPFHHWQLRDAICLARSVQLFRVRRPSAPRKLAWQPVCVRADGNGVTLPSPVAGNCLAGAHL